MENSKDKRNDTFDLVSLSAVAEKKAIFLNEETPAYKDKFLRLYIEGKGCDGFIYGVTFDNKADDDLCFPFKLSSKLILLVDSKTFEFVKGSTIDWVDDDRGQGFLVNNPRHKRFKGKFYMRPFWRKQFTGKQEKDI